MERLAILIGEIGGAGAVVFWGVFLLIQKHVQTPDETVPIVSKSETNSTRHSTSDSTSALSQ